MMAQEEVKQSKKDIEIDTDDVTQEELTVEVKESANNVETKQKPNLDFGEVDLGYQKKQKMINLKSKLKKIR
jgi:hypothetical protein